MQHSVAVGLLAFSMWKIFCYFFSNLKLPQISDFRFPTYSMWHPNANMWLRNRSTAKRTRYEIVYFIHILFPISIGFPFEQHRTHSNEYKLMHSKFFFLLTNLPISCISCQCGECVGESALILVLVSEPAYEIESRTNSNERNDYFFINILSSLRWTEISSNCIVNWTMI